VIEDTAAWKAWERETLLRQPADFRRNLRLLEAMYEEARALGIMAAPPAPEGLESRLRLARALNGLSGAVRRAAASPTQTLIQK
jgi:hypothetical protein